MTKIIKPLYIDSELWEKVKAEYGNFSDFAVRAIKEKYELDNPQEISEIKIIAKRQFKYDQLRKSAKKKFELYDKCYNIETTTLEKLQKKEKKEGV